MMLSMILLLSVVFLENRIAINARDCGDNSIVIAAFSGSLCNGNEMSLYIKPEKTDDNGIVTYDFNTIINNTPILVEGNKDLLKRVERILVENVTNSSKVKGVLNNIQVSNLIIYNVTYNETIIKEYTQNDISVKKMPMDEVVSPNGIKITNTSLYIKAGFEYNGLLIRGKKVYLEKCIELKRLS